MDPSVTPADKDAILGGNARRLLKLRLTNRTERRMTRAITAVLLASAVLASGATVSAQDYPTKAIKIVVAFAAGGGNDLLARIVGQELSIALKQPVIIENRPGAGTQIGASESPARRQTATRCWCRPRRRSRSIPRCTRSCRTIPSRTSPWYRCSAASIRSW